MFRHIENIPRRRWAVIITAGLLSLGFFHSAQAQEWVFSQERLSLRPWPSFHPPEVAWVAPHQEVFVHGCLPHGSWCEVSWRQYQGWVPSHAIGMEWGRGLFSHRWGRFFFPARRHHPVLRFDRAYPYPNIKVEPIDRTPHLPDIVPALPDPN